MNETANELRVRQEIADRIAKARSRRLAARARNTRRGRRITPEF